MAETCKTIPIKNTADRILARMHVREAAHHLSFDLLDQARISMAAYNVINRMDMGITCDGEVAIARVQDGKRKGMQVTCTAMNPQSGVISAALFSEARSLVDELKVEKISPNGERVIVMIWANQFCL